MNLSIENVKKGQGVMEIENTNEKKRETLNTSYNKSENGQVVTGLSSLPPYILDWIESRLTEAIIIWREGKAIFATNSVKNIFGYRKSEIIGMNWHHFVSPKEINRIRENFDPELDETQQFNIYILNKHNKYVWAECTVKILHEENSVDEFMITSLKDITEKKETEELMIRSEKMSIAGQLSAAIAHEIRNPLTSIKGFLQLLQAGINRNDEYYKIMIDEIEKIEKITSEMLSISKPNTENREIEPLINMIKEVTFLLEPEANANGIIISVKEPMNESVVCDRSQMKQVFINIIKNAIEAMESTGEITIFTERTQTSVVVNITDEGPGIPEEMIERLGEPFFTTKKNGTGLGLMITKQLLERHGGSLNIKNNPEIGCTFQLIFPLSLSSGYVIHS
jgi:two-component system sporulation sensor kinase A